MKSNSNAGHSFSQVPSADIERSSFDRSHSLKTTFDFDALVPFFVDEVLPSDTHKLKANLFGRLATPIHPLMDNAFIDTFYFFVPMRLVWENYYKFFGGQDDPDDSIDYEIPTAAISPVSQDLYDYFGLPIGTSVTHSILPIRAYWLIIDEWFRDQNLQESRKISKGDTSTVYTNTATYPSTRYAATRGKRHDYFTSCLPWAQKGTASSVPLGDSAPIVAPLGGTDVEVRLSSGTGGLIDLTANLSTVQTGGTGAGTNELYADLANATSASINEWRTAFQIQKFLERNARSGTRYTEFTKSHFGASSADSRLQRPEYLGGSSQRMNIHPVQQTSSTDATTPQGNLSGFGTFSEDNSGFTKSFTEHGYIIGIVNARADLTYQQGVDKLWTRSTQYDFYFPTFAHLGEQAVLNKEIYHQATSADDDVFGYQERYAEYRYKKSNITGLFRSAAASSLDAWHLSQEFTSLPTLGDTFIKSTTPVDRVIAVPAEPHVIMDCFFDYTSVRPMPTYAPPGFIDHF